MVTFTTALCQCGVAGPLQIGMLELAHWHLALRGLAHGPIGSPGLG